MSTASQSALSPLLLGFEQGSSAARRRFGRQGCHHAGVPGFYWAILDLCRWTSLLLKSSARRTTYHKVSLKRPLFCSARLAITVFRAILLELHSIWSSFKGDVSLRAALPNGRPISIVAKPLKYPSVGQGTCRKKGESSRDECLSEPLFSFLIFEHFDQHPAFNLFEAACLVSYMLGKVVVECFQGLLCFGQNHVRISKLGIPEICAPQLL
jgi:hypothetical protein